MVLGPNDIFVGNEWRASLFKLRWQHVRLIWCQLSCDTSTKITAIIEYEASFLCKSYRRRSRHGLVSWIKHSKAQTRQS